MHQLRLLLRYYTYTDRVWHIDYMYVISFYWARDYDILAAMRIYIAINFASLHRAGYAAFHERRHRRYMT